MTTITFNENISISNKKKSISINEFIEILENNWYLPKLFKVNENECTKELIDWAEECLKLKDNDFVNY